ncbi:MAG: hypothetical protein NTV51_01385 [Verrucomicrobia bacterium]|nr:hypothetical protein [Verrucomicrobiota bacterium]
MQRLLAPFFAGPIPGSFHLKNLGLRSNRAAFLAGGGSGSRLASSSTGRFGSPARALNSLARAASEIHFCWK